MNQSSPTGQNTPTGAPQARALCRARKGSSDPTPSVRRTDPRPGMSSWWRRGAPASPTGAHGAEVRNLHGQPWVFVLSQDKEPLGLAHPAVVRMWRTAGKARMHRMGPNVVRLLCPHAQACFIRKSQPGEGDVVEARIGVDPGAKVSGLALVLAHRVVWTCELAHRSASISKRMTQRAGARSARRCRRKQKAGRGPKEARWRHRCRKPGWLPPSVYHRVQSIRRWVRWLRRFAAPMTTSLTAHVEVSAFDTHKVLHPEVAGADYQHGPLYRANLRGFVITRNSGRCVYCTTSSDNARFEIDHVIARGVGSDRHWNRVAACAPCNLSKGRRSLEQWLAGDPPHAVKNRAGAVLDYVALVSNGHVKMSAMAAANIVGPCTAKKLEADGMRVTRNTGADTAAWRQMTGVAKSHAVDAATCAGQGETLAFRCEHPVQMMMTGRGRRLVVRRNSSGFPALKNDGTPVNPSRWMPQHRLRAGDVVRIDKEGFGRRTRIATLTTARSDGRCVGRLKSGAKINIMASRLALIHHGCGAYVQ